QAAGRAEHHVRERGRGLPRRCRGQAALVWPGPHQRRHRHRVSGPEDEPHGDIVIDAIPVIDYLGGGSAIEFLTTIDRMLTLDFDTAIPAHARTMTKQEVPDYRMRFA